MGLSYKRLRRHFKALVEGLGWPTTTPHKLRHSFVSHAAMNGTRSTCSSGGSGTARCALVEVYAHVSDVHSPSAMAALPTLPNRQHFHLPSL